jgi:hypothetical protein
VNGDGAVDVVTYPDQFYGKVYVNKSAYAMLPSSLQLPTGATTSIGYKAAAQYRDAGGAMLNPNLPVPVKTVATLATTVNGVTSTDSYVYQGGAYVNRNSAVELIGVSHNVDCAVAVHIHKNAGILICRRTLASRV